MNLNTYVVCGDGNLSKTDAHVSSKKPFYYQPVEITDNKGKVLVPAEEGSEFVTQEYADIPVDTRYMTWEKEFFFLFVKKEQGTLDKNLGWFNSFQQAADAFNVVGMPEDVETGATEETVMEVTKK